MIDPELAEQARRAAAREEFGGAREFRGHNTELPHRQDDEEGAGVTGWGAGHFVGFRARFSLSYTPRSRIGKSVLSLFRGANR